MYKAINDLLKMNKDNELSEQFIQSAFDIMVENEPGLFEYLSGIKIDNEIDSEGNYDTNSKIISINSEAISSLGMDDIFKILVCIYIVKHEIEHAKNMQRLDEGRVDIESIVIRYSLADYIKLNNLDHEMRFENVDPLLFNIRREHNYDIDPGERIADIKAWKFMVNLLKNRRNSIELSIARESLYHSYIRGYHDNRYYLDAPTYTYLLNMEMYFEYSMLKQTVDMNNYSLDTRVLCGLPITYQEQKLALAKKARIIK